jgi:predicted PurR-regulated permease PerM
MKRWFLISIMILAIPGCGGLLSPRLQEQIDNQDGKIEDIKHNLNGIIVEMGKLRNESEIHARDLDNFQQGLMNIKAQISSNENSGIQILQGDGALMMIFGLGAIGIISAFYYRERARKSKKSANMLAQAIAGQCDTNLDDEVFRRAMNTDVEKEVYHLMVRNQRR